MAHEWVKVGAKVGIIQGNGDRAFVLDIGTIEVVSARLVKVATVDRWYVVNKETLIDEVGGVYIYNIRIVPVTDPMVVAATVRVQVRKVGRTLVSMADDPRYRMGDLEVADLIAMLVTLKDQVNQEIAELSETLP